VCLVDVAEEGSNGNDPLRLTDCEEVLQSAGAAIGFTELL
jgi:hypothetical protein